MDVVNSLVSFVLSVWLRPHHILPQPLTMSLSMHKTHLYGRYHMDFTKCFNVVMSDLYLAYFFPQGG